MKTPPSPLYTAGLAVVAVMAAAPGTARAQAFDELDRSSWSLRLGATARFNVNTSLAAIPPAAGPGVYNDGFVLPDVGGTSSGLTWNWGYESASQVVGDNLLLNRLDGVPSIGTQDVSGSDLKLGGELIVAYRIASFRIAKKPAEVGLEIGYGYSRFSQGLSFEGAGIATRTTDTYSLGGVIPPPAPYAGTETGPGPLIPLQYASRAVVTSVAATSFQGDLDVAFHEFRFGPALSVQLGKRLGIALGAGYSSVYPDVKLRYTETTTFSNPSVPPLSPLNVDVNKGKWRPGIYAELRLNYQFTDHWGLSLGGGYQYNTSYSFDTPGHTLEMELGSTFTAKAAVSYHF